MNDLEICICAAVRMKDGYIIRGHRHHDAMNAMGEIPGYSDARPFGVDQGFVTSRNRYVNRVEAMQLQLAAGIPCAAPDGEYWGTELYSEDLY